MIINTVKLLLLQSATEYYVVLWFIKHWLHRPMDYCVNYCRLYRPLDHPMFTI